MNRELLIAVMSMCFISACMGFLLCFFAMGGFDYERPKKEPESKGQQEQVVVQVYYEQPIMEAEPEAETVYKETSLGEYKLTAYCACDKCCGTRTGITASGTTATEGRTIAVDPSVIPLGSVVMINGQKYIAEDTGSGVTKKHIDIYFENHKDAEAFGVQSAEVYLLEEE